MHPEVVDAGRARDVSCERQHPTCVVPIRLLLIACAGSIPEELGGLSKLEVLRLDDNKLTGKGVSTGLVESERSRR